MIRLLAALTLPLQGVITQGYSDKHPAVDIACRAGTPVVAAHGGKVTIRRTARMGNGVIITNDEHRSEYWHLDSVVRQTEVKQGEIIGRCGNTGRLTTGPHLHFEIL